MPEWTPPVLAVRLGAARPRTQEARPAWVPRRRLEREAWPGQPLAASEEHPGPAALSGRQQCWGERPVGEVVDPVAVEARVESRARAGGTVSAQGVRWLAPEVRERALAPAVGGHRPEECPSEVTLRVVPRAEAPLQEVKRPAVAVRAALAVRRRTDVPITRAGMELLV